MKIVTCLFPLPMVHFERLILPNGVTALMQHDKSTPLVAVNVLVQAGSKYDPPHQSGLAHLFEHLMFSGTPRVPDFDVPMQRAGGENNAYTNADYATYYAFGPATNLETFLWLEQDRFCNLSVTQERLDLEKKVVLEEFRDTCINEPFGDLWHHLLPLAYGSHHRYSMPTIGTSFDSVSAISLEGVHKFQQEMYSPTNMIVSLSGGVSIDRMTSLLEDYFGHLQADAPLQITDDQEQAVFQNAHIRCREDVPIPAFYLAFPVPSRLHEDYLKLDLLTEVLTGGRSSLLYRRLVKDEALLTQVDSYLSGAVEGGLLIIEGKVSPTISFDQLFDRLWVVLGELEKELLEERLITRLRNTLQTNHALAEMNILSKALNLAYFEMLGHAERINEELETSLSIAAEDLKQVSAEYLRKDRAIVLEYGVKKVLSGR